MPALLKIEVRTMKTLEQKQLKCYKKYLKIAEEQLKREIYKLENFSNRKFYPNKNKIYYQLEKIAKIREKIKEIKQKIHIYERVLFEEAQENCIYED